MDSIRFLKHKVVNDTKKTSVRVHYSLDNRFDGRKVVTVYAKEYGRQLSAVFDAGVKNDSDTMTDYFQTDRIHLFEDHPLYLYARCAVEKYQKEYNIKRGIVEKQPEPTCVKPLSASDVEYCKLMNRIGVQNLFIFETEIQ